MPKVFVKASQEFFDRHNQINRPEGSEFLLKDEAYKEFHKAGYVDKTDQKEKESPKVTRKNKKAGPAKKAGDMSTTRSIKK